MARKPAAPTTASSTPRLTTPAAAIAAGGLLHDYGFGGPSWNRWRAVLRATYGETLTAEEEALFREVAQRDPPSSQVKELWCICGRRAGKDSIASAIATIASLGDYSKQLRPGERATVMCLAADRDQARIVFRYILGYFETVPGLSAMVLRATDDAIELANGSEILVSTNSFRAVRGRSVVCAILDEVAFYRSDESANPDSELYTALEPALSTFRQSLLIGISTPYRRSGLLFDKWRESYGKPDPDVLVVQGPSRLFNEVTLSQATVDRRLLVDPEAGAAEYLAQWRDDLSGFLERELVESAVDEGIASRSPNPGIEYKMFIDPSGGRGDSCAAAVAHADGDHIIIDALYERKSPFNPTDAVADIAALAREYGLSRVVGDNYGAQWTVEGFSKAGLLYEKSDRARSAIYLDVLPLFTAGRLRLIDNARLNYQFINLVRQTSKSGKDTVHKAEGGRDDLANCCAGAAVLVADDGRAALIRPGDLLADGVHAVEAHERPEAFLATLWLDRQGGCGWTIWSYRFVDGLEPVPLVLVDFDRGAFNLGVLTDVVARLDALHSAVIRAQPQLVHSVAVCLSVPQQLVDAAWAAMEPTFGELRVLMESVAMLRGMGARIGVDEVDAAFLEQVEQVMLDAAAIVAMGKVKMSATALQRSRGRPLAGILSAPAGERVDADPLRVAALVEIRGLGDAMPTRSNGAAVRWG